MDINPSLHQRNMSWIKGLGATEPMHSEKRVDKAPSQNTQKSECMFIRHLMRTGKRASTDEINRPLEIPCQRINLLSQLCFKKITEPAINHAFVLYAKLLQPVIILCHFCTKSVLKVNAHYTLIFNSRYVTLLEKHPHIFYKGGYKSNGCT